MSTKNETPVVSALDRMVLAAKNSDAFAFRNAFNVVMAEKVNTVISERTKRMGKSFLQNGTGDEK